jgi:plasmid stabilization system protein ParE
MPHLVWTPGALSDVARLRRFLSSKSPEAATRAVLAIRRGVRPLADHPDVGRPVPDLPIEFREWPVRFGSAGYVVRYRHSGTNVFILAVRHGREDGW